MTKPPAAAPTCKAGFAPMERTFVSRHDINLAEIALLLALLFAGLQFALFGWRVVSFPYPLDYGEGPLLDQVQRLSRFENIYRADLATPPFKIANYPPLYLLAQVPLYWLAGPAFWYGRALSAFSMIAAAAFLGLTVHTLTKQWLPGLVAGLMLLATPFARTWAPLMRIDPLALALSWAALLTLVRWSDGRHTVAVTAALLTAAVYTRQSYGLAAPLAAFVWLLSQGQPKRAFTLAGLTAALGLGLFLALHLLTDRGFFFHIITANVNVYRFDVLLRYAIDAIQTMPLLLALSALFVLAGAWLKMRAWWLAAPYLLGATASAATVGKIGSNVNYLLELCAAVSLTTSLIVAWVAQKRATARRRLAWQAATVVLCLALGGQGLVMATTPIRYEETLLYRTADVTEPELLRDIIRLADGSILTGEHIGLLVLEGRPVLHQPFEMRQLARSGLWDQTPLLDMLGQQQFALVLMFAPPGFDLTERRWTPEMIETIKERYKPAYNVGATAVYTPRTER